MKPDLDTKFHIDLAWWRNAGRDFWLYLHDSLCPSCQKEFSLPAENREVDWVNPETAEVKRVNEMWSRLLSCCSRKPDYINPGTPLTIALFRALLANGNEPLTPNELQQRIGKSSPRTILRVLTGRKVPYGIVCLAF